MTIPYETKRRAQRGTRPFFLLRYRRVKTYSIYQNISSLVFVIFLFIMSCKCFWNKMAPFMERSGSTSEIHVQCRTLWSVVNCWIRYNDLCCKLCNISDLVNQCIRPSCTLGVSTYPQKKKKKQIHYIKYHLFSMKLSCVVSQYLLGNLGDPHDFL
jgi:hypothetical protein